MNLDRFHVVLSPAGHPVLECSDCPNHWSILIEANSLASIVVSAEAHLQVVHSDRPAPSENAWSDATDPINSDGPNPLDELSVAAERALRAAASEILPLLTKLFTRPR